MDLKIPLAVCVGVDSEIETACAALTPQGMSTRFAEIPGGNNAGDTKTHDIRDAAGLTEESYAAPETEPPPYSGDRKGGSQNTKELIFKGYDIWKAYPETRATLPAVEDL
ncbi:uncharacterized protein N7473_001852 [Penicillium subrubescens]|uniref:uncharacterized protein n=1 Tax=Penicillium subrubescens TaxID=1316194 RepID=UPI0025453F53|nr:uncharacterized protein N7473_001852 [Penicillium subrubescens]KAJ5904936.1 hypothetical protein N7473_001852 [Penicillium subrubescens]